jgi:hypothetical protein
MYTYLAPIPVFFSYKPEIMYMTAVTNPWSTEELLLSEMKYVFTLKISEEYHKREGHEHGAL